MKNLLKKIIGMKEKPKIETMLYADEIKPFFKSLGIDIEQIGFPHIEKRNLPTIDGYFIIFNNVRAMPVKIEGSNYPTIIVKGTYIMQAKSAIKEGDKWYPGSQTAHYFEIKHGELNIEGIKCS